MVCQSEESSNIQYPSETTVFLPIEEHTPSEAEAIRRTSRTLSVLVLTEGIPIDPEKVAFDITSNNGDKEKRRVSVKSVENGVLNEAELARSKKGCSNYTGILLTLASGILFTIGGVIVKYMKDYHPFTLGIFRFQGILLPSLFMVLYACYVQKLPIFDPVWPLTDKEKAKRCFGMLLRSAFGSTALFLHFYALKRIDVADVLVIGSCQPVFVTLAAYFFLGESCGVFPVFTALLTILGVGVISRPPILTGEEAFDNNALIGAGFSFASVLTATMVFVIIRYLKDVHFSMLTLVLGCWGTVVSIIGSVIVGEFRLPQSLEHWALAVALAVITLLGQVLLTLALQCEQAGPVSLIRTADCLFAFVLQFVLLNTLPDLFSLTGASIIIFCVILTAFRKWISTLPKEHPARKKFSFVLA
ncbi:Solute carrier family 35 member G1 [Orchesella cincta]|uniref:Solute carrier family 35 member G1 n=1 Tax=Orchesella cincta TaxID=48709 RepID=A0A1D2N732_ORCCI|nr:Solute carrier family 35 member G1 [Orchesella cincta]